MDVDQIPDSFEPESEMIDSGVISWEMDEYLSHKRSLAWYVVLFLGASVFSMLAYLATEQGMLAPIAIMSMAVIVAIYLSKKPQRHVYSMNSVGLEISGRNYDFESFKTFSVIDDNGITAIYLITNQRFIPPLTLYLPEDKSQDIIDIISEYVAYNPSNLQLIDRLMSYLRF